MLGYYGMSLTGKTHLAAGEKICQDAHGVKQLGKNLIVAAIADGLGSARHSETGAQAAVDIVLRFVEKYLPLQWHDASLMSLLQTAYNAALRVIYRIAEKQRHDIKEYDTTLTAVIYNGTNAVYGHVGDGGIVALSKWGEYSVLTTAQKGEEHNVVVPLRMGPGYWLFGTSGESLCSLLMMTDGIYDIVCPAQLAKKDPPVYINFIRPFMDTNILAVKTEKDFTKAQSEIQAYLDSEETKYITDDKTIVGIINTDVKPEIKPGSYYAEPNWAELAKQQRQALYKDKKNPVKQEPLSLFKKLSVRLSQEPRQPSGGKGSKQPGQQPRPGHGAAIKAKGSRPGQNGGS
jgi:serine/threonine protein phosphatase PrpC